METKLIYTSVVNEIHVKHFLNVQFAPSLFQEYISKSVELRVTVVGNQVFAVQLHSQDLEKAKHDWRRVPALELSHTPCELPRNIREKCILLVRTLELAFGAIDLILTPDGEYIFLEINPNGQWAWIEQLCPDLHIRNALISLLASAGNLNTGNL